LEWMNSMNYKAVVAGGHLMSMAASAIANGEDAFINRRGMHTTYYPSQ